MVKTFGKMHRTNSRIRAYLEENGFTDITFFPHTRFSKDLHLAGLEFDGIAMRGSEVVFFQAKTNKKPTRGTIQKYIDFHKFCGARALWFNWRDYEGLEVYP